jgi:hypothetical protein
MFCLEFAQFSFLLSPHEVENLGQSLSKRFASCRVIFGISMIAELTDFSDLDD